MNKKTFYISTPIYYPSGKPHVGHAFSTILADVLAKYKKLIGYETFFATGTDEHGKKIEENAIKNNMSTIDFVDKNVAVFKDLWSKLGVDYSRFVRTTNIEHIRTVQRIFSDYLAMDLIYLDSWNGKYCVSCEENILPKDIVIKDGEEYCPVGHKVTETCEPSYFFKMSKFESWIKETFKLKKDWIIPESRVNELNNNFLDNNLKDLSISRTSFSWGIPILENEKHVLYVWMDALFNYLTILDFKQKDDSLYQKFWNHEDAEIVHLLSKEIIRFHCVYWPIFLHALDIKLPTKILSHGWIVTKTGKMSKSLGNVIDPFEIIEKYGRDCLRYYLMKDMSLVNDNTFMVEQMISTFNGDLANNVGNLLSRTIGMIKKYNNQIIPAFNENDMDSDDKQLLNELVETNQNIVEAINKLNPGLVLQHIQYIVDKANKYIELKKPWELFKNNETKQLNVLLNNLCQIIKSSFYWLQPIVIDGLKEASEQFNYDFTKATVESLSDFKELDNNKLNEAKPIFVRIVEQEI